MENGNIPKYLHANENAEPPINRVLLLSDIASGMTYLHSNGIVHGDLKAANVLISASHRACLTDFGLSTTSEVPGWTSPPKMRAPGAPRWHAPELSDPRDRVEIKITTMSDVYSFGNVCYEIMTGKLPLYETKNNTRVQLRVLRGDRPSKPALQDPAFRRYGLTEGVWNFIQACWLQEPEQRPTAKELCEHPVLSSLADHRPPQEWGEGSAVDFRSRHASNSSSKPPNPGGSTHSKPLPRQEPAERTSPVDGYDALAKVVEAVGEGHCPVSTIRAHLLRVLASEDIRQKMLRLGKARSEKWVDAFQMVLDSDPSNMQGDRGRFMGGLLCLSIARGEHPKALQLKVPVEKEAEPVEMGPSGELYRGRAFGGDAAIKVLKTYRSRNRVDFIKVMLSEVIISCYSQHPNILPCYGIYNPQSQAPVGLVSPWMGNGNVGDYLRGNPQANRLLLVGVQFSSCPRYLLTFKVDFRCCSRSVVSPRQWHSPWRPPRGECSRLGLRKGLHLQFFSFDIVQP
ncbi:kinase-like protein [Coprinellus micaceus]|uniref:Kinase-like protein n=1 Tax=Coprinellus micaceus TaxID=71717 RepID=A0A4Y7TCN2_COPMI|nr:kinase-like protein [Coprinellus micaceus]